MHEEWKNETAGMDIINFGTRNTRIRLLCMLLLVMLLLPACQDRESAAAVDLIEVVRVAEGAQGGWKAEEEAKLFTKETLFELMNGQSDAFFVYGFEQAAVQRFNSATGINLVVSVFRVDTPESAYGLFSVNRDSQPAEVGNDGSTSPGRRLSYWQERFFVQMTALKPVPEGDLLAMGQAISARLPKGGKKPALMAALPADGMYPEPFPLFFHQELTIQDRVWLGGENKLGLGLDTDGALARYDLSGQPAELMVIEFPDATRAKKALQALQAGEQEDLLAAAVAGERLAAVFGEAEKAAAETLVDKVAR